MKKKLSTRAKFWLRHVHNQEKSGLSQIQYCKLHKINNKSFSAQKSVLRKKIIIEDDISQKVFIPLKKKEHPHQFSIKLNSGVELKFDSLPEASWISQVLSSMDLNHVES